ncbi:MAG: precorrin-6A reductase [Eubacteriales bacterium]|nr:precorrin-6A reductase [Eubacteriales bacterium]
MCKLIIFAGTTEGRELAEFLSRRQIPSLVCVATEYGGQLLGENEYREVSSRRLDQEEMCRLFEQKTAGGREDGKDNELLVVDATHPYAAVVSENIKAACEKTGAEYVRLLRPGEKILDDSDDAVCVSSVEEAVEFLKGTQGNVLVTTGSKELAKFTLLDDYQERIFARVLSTPEVAAACAQLGFTGRHLICMQGPFSEEMNTAMLRQFGAKWLVTKESGKTGGFGEKIRAARIAGAKVVLIGRPGEEKGRSLSQVKSYLAEKIGFDVKRQISIVGIGMGTRDNLTVEALKACREAQLIVGARRMLENVKFLGKDEFISYKPDEIYGYIKEHPEYEKVALLQSGDVGFYSGAKKLLETFAQEEVVLYPGISSVVYFCARLHTAWEDVKLVSLHGRCANIIGEISRNRKVFALVGKGEGVTTLLRKMADYGMGNLTVSVGEDLSYESERIRRGSADSLKKESFRDLCVVLIENPGADPVVTHGLEDEEFLRDKVPMTKSEVRCISLSKLRLHDDSIVYDVGAGTGSVSVEAALQAVSGRVYAVEKKQEAVALIKENKKKFAADNLTVVEGLAPEALAELPEPTHVFIGGSSGNLKRIMETVLAKNPLVRIVINCIALETVSEALECIKTLPVTDTDIVCVSAARSKQVGSYHMMMGQNPVYIISCTGGGIV